MTSDHTPSQAFVAGGVREEIARIVNPHAFKAWQGQYDHCIRDNTPEFSQRCADYFHKARCDEALAVADKLLARFASPTPAPGGMELADELKLLVNEFDPANSDWGFRKGVILGLIDRLARTAAQSAVRERTIEEWLPIDAIARDGRELLLRQGIDGPIFAGYFGLANMAWGSGASTMWPWVVLDNTNGTNLMRDGGESGLTHYRSLAQTGVKL